MAAGAPFVPRTPTPALLTPLMPSLLSLLPKRPKPNWDSPHTPTPRSGAILPPPFSPCTPVPRSLFPNTPKPPAVFSPSIAGTSLFVDFSFNDMKVSPLDLPTESATARWSRPVWPEIRDAVPPGSPLCRVVLVTSPVHLSMRLSGQAVTTYVGGDALAKRSFLTQ